MIEVVSYSCSLMESPLPSSKTNVSCAAAFLCFFGFGMGVINAARRRDSMICCVGCPVSSSSQCRRVVAQSAVGDALEVGRLDRVAERAGGVEAHIIGQDQQ